MITTYDLINSNCVEDNSVLTPPPLPAGCHEVMEAILHCSGRSFAHLLQREERPPTGQSSWPVIATGISTSCMGEGGEESQGWVRETRQVLGTEKCVWMQV